MKSKPPPAESHKALNRAKANRQKQQKKEREELSKIFYQEIEPAQKRPDFDDLCDSEQGKFASRMWGIYEKFERPLVEHILQQTIAALEIMPGLQQDTPGWVSLISALEVYLYRYIDKIAADPLLTDLINLLKSFDEATGKDSPFLKEVGRLKQVRKTHDKALLLDMVLQNPRLLYSEYVVMMLSEIIYAAQHWHAINEKIPLSRLEIHSQLYNPQHLTPDQSRKLVGRISDFFQSLLKKPMGPERRVPEKDILKALVDKKAAALRQAGEKAPRETAKEQVAQDHGVSKEKLNKALYPSKK